MKNVTGLSKDLQLLSLVLITTPCLYLPLPVKVKTMVSMYSAQLKFLPELLHCS